MITMKKLSTVKKVPSEEAASRLEQQGYERVGGAADPVLDRPATVKDLQEALDGFREQISAMFREVGQAMCDRLYGALTAAPEKTRTAKSSKKEAPDGGADQPDRADGAK